MKPFSLFTVVSIVLIVTASISTLASAEESIQLSKPPTSLAQWYKPQNKRNVWQHNMFKLRREIQAVKEYVIANDKPHAKKWALNLVEHYRKIAEMVPEWKDELELGWVNKIKAAATQGDLKKLSQGIRKIQTSCKGCHNDYRAQVAAIYRAPDFSNIMVKLNGKDVTYSDFMKMLMRDVNRIKIASEDQNKTKAMSSLLDVRQGIEILRSSCNNCHKGDTAKDYYLGNQTEGMLDRLESAIDTGKNGRALGEFAVQACARCHGSHRIIYDLKNEIE